MQKKGDIMSVLIQLTSEEKALAEKYAMRHALSLDEAFTRALFEKIEDEYDITVAKEAYKEYAENPRVYSHEEMKEILGL